MWEECFQCDPTKHSSWYMCLSSLWSKCDSCNDSYNYFFQIVPNGAASNTNLRVGDRILAVSLDFEDFTRCLLKPNWRMYCGLLRFEWCVFQLQVNGKDMARSTHHDAVTALISNVSSIKMLVRHDPPPPGLMVGICNENDRRSPQSKGNFPGEGDC